MGKSHDIVREVKRRMLDALHAREDIARRVHSYRLEGRTKALVSTFRKVGIARKSPSATNRVGPFILMRDTLGWRRTACVTNERRWYSVSSNHGGWSLEAEVPFCPLCESYGNGNNAFS